MARPYSVLSQRPEPKRRRKVEATAEPKKITGWRARPRDPDMFGIMIRPFYGTENEVRAWADENADMRPLVECLTGAVYGTPPRQVPSVADLAHEGMAHPTEDGKAWKITALGQDVLTDAMRGLDE